LLDSLLQETAKENSSLKKIRKKFKMEIFLHRKILCLVILLVFPTVESQESSKNFKKIIKMLKNLDGKVANIDLQIQQLTNKVEENSGKIDVLTSFVQTIVPDLKNEIKEKFSCHFCPEEEMAILITGGYQNYQSEYRSVEALTGEGNQLCKLADLPDDRMYHTMDGEMLCGGIQTKKSCLQYKDGIWNVLPWQMMHERKRHVSWASGGEVVLMGGTPDDQLASELVSPSGTVEDFPTKVDHTGACSIQFDDYVVVTGGHNDLYKTRVYGESGWIENLGNLNVARRNHGCGHYYNDDSQLVYLVACGNGETGYDSASSEILVTGTSEWSLVGDLAFPRHNVKGISINNNIFLIGGTGEGNYLTDIVKFNKDSKTWEVINNLEKGRMGHAVSLYPLKQIEQHCL